MNNDLELNVDYRKHDDGLIVFVNDEMLLVPEDEELMNCPECNGFLIYNFNNNSNECNRCNSSFRADFEFLNHIKNK